MQEQRTQLTPTPGAAWRAQRAATTVTQLAYSGLTVEIGHVQLDQLLLTGKIPDVLTPIVASVLWSTVGQGKGEDEIRAEKGFYELVNSVVTAALVSPRIVSNPTQDDEIAIDDLDFGDKIVIYTIAIQPTEVLHRFRQGENTDVDTLQQSEALQPATQ